MLLLAVIFIMPCQRTPGDAAEYEAYDDAPRDVPKRHFLKAKTRKTAEESADVDWDPDADLLAQPRSPKPPTVPRRNKVRQHYCLCSRLIVASLQEQAAPDHDADSPADPRPSCERCYLKRLGGGVSKRIGDMDSDGCCVACGRPLDLQHDVSMHGPVPSLQEQDSEWRSEGGEGTIKAAGKSKTPVCAVLHMCLVPTCMHSDRCGNTRLIPHRQQMPRSTTRKALSRKRRNRKSRRTSNSSP